MLGYIEIAHHPGAFNDTLDRLMAVVGVTIGNCLFEALGFDLESHRNVGGVDIGVGDRHVDPLSLKGCLGMGRVYF